MSSSEEEMRPRARSLFTSRLEMAEALQSWLTLAMSEVLALFFLPMASRVLERRTGVKQKGYEEDEQSGKVKVKTIGRPLFMSRN
jgi:hypothetical protein